MISRPGYYAQKPVQHSSALGTITGLGDARFRGSVACTPGSHTRPAFSAVLLPH